MSLVAGDGVRVVPVSHRPRAIPFMIGEWIIVGLTLENRLPGPRSLGCCGAFPWMGRNVWG